MIKFNSRIENYSDAKSPQWVVQMENFEGFLTKLRAAQHNLHVWV